MAVWKKVIVSGSVAELNTVSASLAVVVGASGYNKIGTNQSDTVLSGSFTGSFVGDGAGLTGLVSTLGITGSDSSTGTVQLKTQNLTITGASNEIDTTIAGQTVTIGLVNNPVITGDITIGGNTISSSTATAIELNGSDVEVRGDLQVTGNDIKSSTGATNITLTAGTLTTFAGDIKVSGNDISSSTATALSLSGEDVEVRGDLQVSGNDIKASNGAVNITLTNGTLTTFAGDIKVGGNDIQASDGNNNITLTSNTLTTFAGDIKVVGNDISSSTATALTLSGEDVTVVGDLTVKGNDIKSSTNATAITLSGANVSMPGNLSVAGDLTVNGDLTYLNVANLLVEDKFILLNSGSNSSPSEGGIIIDQGGQSGSAYAWDTATTRWGFTGSLAQNATSFAPDAFVAAVVTSDIPAYQQVGNIRVEAGEIYIYV
ncbi:hypothetical protein EB169_03930 [archaeon]|jgi:hypothetical protein|nr:hypothetical protein [archaeon]NDB54961.1 hypothetical protein [archaeon]